MNFIIVLVVVTLRVLFELVCFALGAAWFLVCAAIGVVLGIPLWLYNVIKAKPSN